MKKLLSIALALLLTACLLVSCGSAKTADAENFAVTQAPSATSDTAASESYSGSGAVLDNTATDVNNLAQYGLKIVYTASLQIETLDMDKSVETVKKAVTDAGGYFSNQYSSGGYSYNGSSYSNRMTQFTIRVPADKYDAFLAGTDSFGNVTSSSSSSDDITSQYIDTQSRLDSLRTQETRLLALLEQSGSLEDMLKIEERLADVRYQIEDLTSTLKTYDNMVSYCTIDMTLEEVSNVTVRTDTFGSRFVEAFKGSMRSVWAFLQNAAIAVVYLLPYLVLAFVIFLIVRAIVRRNRKKHPKQPAYYPPQPAVPAAPAGEQEKQEKK